MLHSGPRDVADTILDDLVELQIAGPDSSGEVNARDGAPPGVNRARKGFDEPEARFEHAFASEKTWEPVEPRELPDRPEFPVREEVPTDECETAHQAEAEPEAEAESVAAEPQVSTAETIAAEPAITSPPTAPSDASIDEPGEALVLRSLLAECGAVVRWLCTKAEEGQLQSADIEVARSFLVMAGLPTQNAGTVGQVQVK